MTIPSPAELLSAPDARAYMRVALGLARRGLGRVFPNPAVGCLIVREGDVVGRGWTQPGGRPHAETQALRQAGGDARGACAYVTLEPCNHHGETPPCSSALIAAGIQRVVIATTDPDPRVCGAGIRALKEAGLRVDVGILRAEADALNAGFFSRIVRARPLFTLKTATTLDGRIATKTGKSQWITTDEARARGHLLRAQHDGIVTGISTVLADDPSLTCRIEGLRDRSPIRIVLDSTLKIPLASTLVRTAGEVPVWVVHRTGADPEKARTLKAKGVELFCAQAGPARGVDLHDAARVLAQRGMTRILVEAGEALSGAFIRADLIDRIAWFRAPSLLGGDAMAAIAALGVEDIAQMPRFEIEDFAFCGADTLAFLRRKP